MRPAGYVDEGLAGAMEIYARRPSDLEDADVTIDLFQVGSDSPLRSVKADLGDTRPVSGGAARAANIAMPLTGVEPGEYVARATLRGHGETVTEVMRQVEVLPGRAPAGPASLEERVTPLMVVNGELGHRFVARIKETSNDPGVANALDAASRGAWDKVIEALPGADDGHGAAGHALRGLAFFAAARFEDAEQAMGRASALDPQSALASFFLGWIRVASGRRPEAISAWRQAVALDRTLVSAYLALADTVREALAPRTRRAGAQRGSPCEPGVPGAEEPPRRDSNGGNIRAGRLVANPGGPMNHLLAALLALALATQLHPLDASRVALSNPATLVVFSSEQLRGFPVLLSWSPDGRQLAIGAVQRDRWANEKSWFYVHTIGDSRLAPVEREPDWAGVVLDVEIGPALPRRAGMAD